MKMKKKMKKISPRWDINKLRSKHGHKYRTSVSMMMLICIKQHLNNIWSSIHEKVSNTEAEFKKSVAY